MARSKLYIMCVGIFTKKQDIKDFKQLILSLDFA